jgi:uncharacterized protein YndB with AHSA1/START domain
MVEDRIEREIVIEAPPQRVWEAVTTAEHLGTWFGDAGAEIDLRPGGALMLRWKDFGEVRGRVEQVEPPRFFSYHWGWPEGSPIEPGHQTLVEFTLDPDGAGTRLRVVESGFAGLKGDDEAKAKHHEENSGGWTSELAELKSYAEGARQGTA